MRALNLDELEQRKKKVLQTLIHEFIRTGKPVGSKAIAAMGRLGLSSATIRNILSDLDREEMISHPHASAGSTPTDKGYRNYVDSLVELQRLAVQEEARIENEYQARTREVEDLLSQTSRMLSSLSHYTGFIMAPKLDRNVLSHIELLPLSEHRVLVAMITQSGLAKHFVIVTETEIPRDRLRRIARVINQSLNGCSLQEVQAHILDRLENAQADYREIMSMANEIGQEVKKFSASEIYLDGASNILSLPDFTGTNDLHDLFKIIEEKQILSNLLEREMLQERDEQEGLQRAAPPGKKARGRGKPGAKKMGGLAPAATGQSQDARVRVRIGSENPIKAMQNISVISSTYQLADRTAGVLGILGPKRMEYPKMIALVDYVSQMVNRFLKELDKR